jgi:hypothetical protein
MSYHCIPFNLAQTKPINCKKQRELREKSFKPCPEDCNGQIEEEGNLAVAADPGSTPTPKDTTCPKCNKRPADHYGLCAICAIQKRSKDINTSTHASKKRPYIRKVKPSNKLNLSFGDHQEMLTELKESAKDHFRTPEAHAMYLIKEGLGWLKHKEGEKG